MMSRRLVVVFAAFLTTPLAAQAPPGAERTPKKPIELEREAERVRTQDLARQRYALPPLTSRALRKAVEAMTGDQPSGVAITARWGEFLTADGKYFVPVQLASTSELGLVAGQPVVAFGAVFGADGQELLSFEVEKVLATSGANLFTDLPLPLEPGEYRGVFGLADGKEPKGLVSLSLNPQPIAADQLTASRLLLAESLFALPTAQAADEPFAFGGIKVVLRGDSRFDVGEQPWAFLVLRQLGRDGEGRPRLAIKLGLEGPEGTASKLRSLPIADPTPTPLKGFAGQWGLGLPLDLARYAPGRYRLSIAIEDLNRHETRTVDAQFEVIPR